MLKKYLQKQDVALNFIELSVKELKKQEFCI